MVLERLALSLSRQLGGRHRGARGPGRARAASTPATRRRRGATATTCSARDWADPLLRHSSWHVPGELDLAAMRIGADALLGEHDFAAFCRQPQGETGADRAPGALDRAGRQRPGDDRLWIFEIEANAFCHQMVRSLVGTLVAVGQGRIRAGELLDDPARRRPVQELASRPRRGGCA